MRSKLIMLTDVDECTKGIDHCHVNVTCNNTEGSYNCSCKNGFTGDGFVCEGENSKNLLYVMTKGRQSNMCKMLIKL